MTSSYKNLNNKDKNSKYITKGDFDFQYSDYQKLKLAEQYNELYLKQYNINKENDKIIENSKIFNLSLNDLFKNTSNVFSNLLNDIVIFINQDKKTVNEFFIIFTQKERLIYIGLLCVLLAFSMWLIDVSK
tara:strand:- start:162 stop:554 length:393 start_codon:yes stop_codon:yes gene_type:complete